MKNPKPIAFVLTATDHGTMLVNKNDAYQHYGPDKGGIGVGYQIFKKSSCELDEVEFILKILDAQKQLYGEGVVAIDCGANIGTQTIMWSRHMQGWGTVISIEPQERIFYALAGNITINNCFNVSAIWAAVGEETGIINIPALNYFTPTSFGSLELKAPRGEGRQGEIIGQAVNYSEKNTVPVRLMKLDELNLNRLDFIKMDIEGMEIEALKGAENIIDKFKPTIFVEMLKSDQNKLMEFLASKGYENEILNDLNILSVHKSNKLFQLL